MADAALLPDVYEAYRGKVFGIVRHKCGPPLDPEDVASDVWLHIVAGWPKFDGVSTYSWIRRITHNRIIDAYRSQRITRDLTDARWLHAPEVMPDVDIKPAMLQLKPRERWILGWEAAGYRRADGAARLGMPEATYRVYLHRSRQHLRRLTA